MDVLCQAVEEVATEPEDLDGCEGLILGSNLKNNFLKIGQSLVTISDKKLYKKAGYSSFTQYIEQKSEFGFGARQALRLVAATRLVRAFPPSVALPTSERQVRGLVGLEQQQAIKVWVKANLIAQETGVPLTHRLVESVLGKEMPAAYRAASRDWQEFASPDSQYYISPPYVVAAVRKVFGGAIDLDPCSDDRANEVVQSKEYYDADDDGLAAANPWSGRVYINPPVGMVNNDNIQGLFLERAINEYKGGKIDEAVLFLKVAIGQKWFNKVFDYPHCWVSASQQLAAAAAAAPANKGKKKGAAASASASAAAAAADPDVDADSIAKQPRGMVVVYIGRSVKVFCEVFSELGHIPGYNGWAKKSDSSGTDDHDRGRTAAPTGGGIAAAGGAGPSTSGTASATTNTMAPAAGAAGTITVHAVAVPPPAAAAAAATAPAPTPAPAPVPVPMPAQLAATAAAVTSPALAMAAAALAQIQAAAAASSHSQQQQQQQAIAAAAQLLHVALQQSSQATAATAGAVTGHAGLEMSALAAAAAAAAAPPQAAAAPQGQMAAAAAGMPAALVVAPAANQQQQQQQQQQRGPPITSMATTSAASGATGAAAIAPDYGLGNAAGAFTALQQQQQGAVIGSNDPGFGNLPQSGLVTCRSPYHLGIPSTSDPLFGGDGRSSAMQQYGGGGLQQPPQHSAVGQSAEQQQAAMYDQYSSQMMQYAHAQQQQMAAQAGQLHAHVHVPQQAFPGPAGDAAYAGSAFNPTALAAAAAAMAYPRTAAAGYGSGAVMDVGAAPQGAAATGPSGLGAEAAGAGMGGGPHTRMHHSDIVVDLTGRPVGK